MTARWILINPAVTSLEEVRFLKMLICWLKETSFVEEWLTYVELSLHMERVDALLLTERFAIPVTLINLQVKKTGKFIKCYL